LTAAAIVARELAIPAVVGTENATATRSTGQHITVDGDKGTVELPARAHLAVALTANKGDNAGEMVLHIRSCP